MGTATTLHLSLSYLEANQLEAALQDRLQRAGKAEARVDAGSIEADMVAHEIRYTATALTKLQLLLYGEDEPDEPVWLTPDAMGWTEAELREAFGG